MGLATRHWKQRRIDGGGTGEQNMVKLQECEGYVPLFLGMATGDCSRVDVDAIVQKHGNGRRCGGRWIGPPRSPVLAAAGLLCLS